MTGGNGEAASAEASQTIQASSPTDVALRDLESTTAPVAQIPVHISYEIIRLFSEGLYQSPQKAIEELVSNSYDAGARRVHVVLPLPPDSPSTVGQPALPPLWVIDDGHGMDQDGFSQLWRVADSKKPDVTVGRLPIGQFGIGKLAAYVLAWRLTHISKADHAIRITSMNFRRLAGHHQYDSTQPIDLGLRELSVEQAKSLMADLEARDPAAWEMLFGPDAPPTWTVAALTDFKNLYDRLSSGRLGWVLSTGLPLHSDFQVWLNGNLLESSKLRLKVLQELQVGVDDTVAQQLGLPIVEGGITIPGISGTIMGEAQIFENRLTEGKSDQYGRSHGFFVRVRGRVVNLEDELFGIDALNHAAWSRFSMEITADGLRDHLLSSREGVRESDPIRILRTYLHGVFNVCRRAYDAWAEQQLMGLDVNRLLHDAPSVYVTDPLVAGVRRTLESGQESYYVAAPELPDGVNSDEWMDQYVAAATDAVFHRVMFEETGPYDRAVRYLPDTQALIINTQHPFIEKLLASGRSRAGATLFGSSEVLVDVLLQEHGLAPAAIVDFLIDRDRVLRLVAGEEPSTAAEVLRLLRVATTNETALERAVGMAFRVLGFEYERRGGNVPGPDGVLFARLGRGIDSVADYRVVYDSKQSNKPAVPADKINIVSMRDFIKQESADYGFFLAAAYDGGDSRESKVNRAVSEGVEKDMPVTLLRVDDLRRLVELHYRYGVTLTRLRFLFQTAHTVPEVVTWIDGLERELSQLEPQVPLIRLLEALEAAKEDPKARPNVYTARQIDRGLLGFEPERLTASLRAVETIIGRRWLEVETSGDVRLHHTASQIVAEVERHLRNLFGVDPTERSRLRR